MGEEQERPNVQVESKEEKREYPCQYLEKEEVAKGEGEEGQWGASEEHSVF